MFRTAVYLAFSGILPAASGPGSQWWKHVEVLADDRLEGRGAGTPGHQKAAEYIAGEFEKLGLRPAGTKGWFQNVPFQSRQIDESASSLTLMEDGKEHPLTLGKEAYINVRVDPKPLVTAPLYFVGYGLHAPEMKYDDLEGLDLKGKVAVILTGAPKEWPGSYRAHVQAADVRWEALKKSGAIGIATIAKVPTTPWARSSAARLQPQMTAVMPGQEEESGQQVQIVINPADAELFFAGSGHTFKEILALSDGPAPLPKFALNKTLVAKTTVKRSAVTSPNVVALLPGKKKEYVVVSAHSDHLGMTKSFAGDGIFNGAMDNASGVAAVLEVARLLKNGPLLSRGVLFVAVTGEEKGLQGSRYFAKNPTVPRKRIVADCNLDMFMPLHEFNAITMLGMEESTLGDKGKNVAAEFGLQVIPDPAPEQNRFTRSDQYSFIREGIPALAFKFGYTKGSEQERIQAEWLKVRYHAVGDDLQQPVNKAGAERFTEFLSALVRKIANDKDRPAWKPDSFFIRFAQ